MTDVRFPIVEQIPHLRRYARMLVRDRDKADDLVQDCLLRAVSRESYWQAGTNIRAWLFTILHNIYVNDVRKAVRRPVLVNSDDHEFGLAVRPDQFSRVQMSELDLALDTISEEQRHVLLLVGVEGMSYEEVASVLDVPIGTVRSRLHRARQALLKHLDGDTTPVLRKAAG